MQQLALVPAEGGELEVLTEGLDRWVSSFEFSGDGSYIYFRFDNHGGEHLARIRVRDGAIERLTNINDEYFVGHTPGSNEKVSYTVDDGTVVEAFVTKPTQSFDRYGGN